MDYSNLSDNEFYEYVLEQIDEGFSNLDAADFDLYGGMSHEQVDEINRKLDRQFESYVVKGWTTVDGDLPSS